MSDLKSEPPIRPAYMLTPVESQIIYTISFQSLPGTFGA